MKLLTDSASRTYATCAKRFKYQYIEFRPSLDGQRKSNDMGLLR